MKPRPLEETLLALRHVRESPGTEESRREALAALASIQDATLYERAQVAIEGRPELGDALARAFGRRC